MDSHPKPEKSLRRRSMGSLLAGLVGLFSLSLLSLAGYAALIEPNTPLVEVVRVPLADLPAGLQGLRIAHIGDLHITEPGRREARAAALLNQLQPDLLIVSGDFIQHTVHLEQQERWARAAGRWLASLTPPALGIWGSRGNSDISRYGDFNIAFAQEMEAAGVQLLANRGELLTVNGETLWLAGADYASFYPGFLADFRVAATPGDAWIAVGPSAGESTLHRWGDETLHWRNYEFSGRFLRTDAAGGVGVTFYSRFPAGYYQYYYFRSVKAQPALRLAKHGGKLAGPRLDSGVEPAAGRWYRFRVRVESGATATRILARSWPAGAPEPTEWQVEALDEGAGRLEAGSVGLWGIDAGEKRFSDLRVEGWDGVRPLWLREDFAGQPVGERPARWLALGVNAGNVRQAMADAPADVPTILIAHSPDQIGEAAQTGADLMLAGHTHGGQIRLPLVGALTTGTTLGRRYASGLFYLGGRWLYITRGLGTRMLPVRFLCPPEITLLILERGE